MPSVPGTLNFPTTLDDLDSLLREANNVSTTLTSAHNNSITTITVANTTGFPSTGAISIDDEIIYYTGVTATEFTGAIRGSDGSTATSHSGGASVEGRLVARHISILRDATIAIQTKLGIGSSTPVANSLMSGTGVGTSAWTTTPRLVGIGLGAAAPATGMLLTDCVLQQSIGGADPLMLTAPDAAVYNLVGPQTVKIGSAAEVTYSPAGGIGDYRQIHGFVDNDGTGNIVGGSFVARSSGACQAWGINPVAYANHANAIAQGAEIDFGSLVAGGVAYGAVIINTGTENTVAPYIQLHSNGRTAGDGIRISNSGAQPIASTGAILKTLGSVNVSYGIDFTSASCSVAAFRSTGFTVDSIGQLGLGTTSMGGLAHFKGGPQWSSFNYGPALVIDGVRHNSIALLDSTSANPWAITNHSGSFVLSTMPALGNTVSNPINLFSLSSAGKLGLLTGTATASAGAATLNSPTGTITSESLTTAAGAAYTLTLTNSYITATSQVLVTVCNGTNSQGRIYVGRVTEGSGSVVILIENIHASQALNGTIKIKFFTVN